MGRGGTIDEVWNLGTMFAQLARRSTRMLINGIFKQPRILVVVPDVLSKFSKIGNVFFFGFYWGWLIISVWETEPKSKATTVNYFAWRHYWSIEEWEQWFSKTIRQNRMGFSYNFSWSSQVWLLVPPFFPNVSVTTAVTACNVGVFKKTWLHLDFIFQSQKSIPNVNQVFSLV